MMITQILRTGSRLVVLGAVFCAFFLTAGAGRVEAQGFSGQDISNYGCASFLGLNLISGPTDFQGRFVCNYSSNCTAGSGSTNTCSFVTKDAIPRPPQLQVIQIWFVRILYLLWGFSGIAFTGLLVWLGFQYLTSFGNEVAIADVIKRFRKWIIGLALIFLSYPALNTFYRILPISQTECYSNISLPAFQFFFPEACVKSAEQICAETYDPKSQEYFLCVTRTK